MIVCGEYLNTFSQYPYFVAALAEPKVVESIPEPWRSAIAEGCDLTKVNALSTEPGLVLLTVVFVGILLVAVAFLFYLLLLAKEKE